MPMKLIVLDRDGVINEDSEAHVKSPDEWQAIPGSLEAIARLNHAGYRVVVFTNQSGIARGYFDVETLLRIHEKMHRELQEAGGSIDAIFFCPAKDNNHPDRKPNPGMLHALAERLSLNLNGVPVVGDALRDLQAAEAVGAAPMLVRTGKGEQTLADWDRTDIPVFPNLAAVADKLLMTER